MTYTLRDLPLPVKVVASVFLMAVGVGYTSAMIQLHVQDAKTGKPMPTVEDVILKYTGRKKFDPNAPPPVSRLESLVTASDVEFGSSSMAAAFTTEDRAKGELKFKNIIQGKTPDQIAAIKEERKGEQVAFKLWINAPEQARKAAYEDDKFEPPAGQMPKSLTAAFKDGNTIKIKSIIENRCATCHSDGGQMSGVPLVNYACLEPLMAVPLPDRVGDWVRVAEPVSITKLTQSTHAHLLSFAMLFSLTGVIFAYSSWPVWMRCVVGPWVVIAVFADVGLWWLARTCNEWGPFFARGIIFTGFLAGAGLFAQIGLSLFNMYERKGKIVIGLLFIVGTLLGGGFIVKLLVPALPKPKVIAVQPPPKPDNGKNTTDDAKAVAAAIANGMGKAEIIVGGMRKPINALDKLLSWPPVDFDGNLIPPDKVKFNGGDNGNMVAAFFEKDKEFQKFMVGMATQAEKDKLRANREGDREAMHAWVRTPEAARKAAYDANKFDFSALNGKAISPELVKDGKVLIKDLIGARCATCHGPGGKQEDYPLDTYEGLSQYLKPLK